VHVLHARIDVVAARTHLLEAIRLQPEVLSWPSHRRGEPDVPQHLALEHPDLRSFLFLDARRAVTKLRRYVALEHVGRFDEMVVHRNQDEVIDRDAHICSSLRCAAPDQAENTTGRCSMPSISVDCNRFTSPASSKRGKRASNSSKRIRISSRA